MDKGDAIPLNVTKEGNHRIFVGLGWDPNESPDFKDKIGALIGTREKHHDLDLSCFYFDAQKNCLGAVTADPNSYSDPSRSIYHSGDNEEGIGDGDDEQISVELKNLPADIHHLIFKASIKSGHSFNDVAAPEIRLCDGYTDRCFVETPLQSDRDAFVFVHIVRADNGWSIRKIEDFIENGNLSAMKAKLCAYLD